MLWHLQIHPAPGRPDVTGGRVASEALEIGLPGPWRVESSRGFLIEGSLSSGDVQRAAAAVLADPVAETFAVRPCGDGRRMTGRRRSSTSCPSRASPTPRPRAPGDPPRPGLRRRERPDDPHLPGRGPGRRAAPPDPARPGQRRRRAGGRRPPAVRPARPGAPVPRSAASRSRIRGMDDAALMRLSKRRPALPQPRRDADDPGPLRRRSAATRPTASWRPSPRPGASTARTRRSRGRIEFEGEVIDNLLKETIFEATQRPRTSTGASASSRTTPASSGSTTSTTSASRSRRTTTPRPSSPTAGRTPGSAA